MTGYELMLSAEAERCIEEQLLWYEADEAQGGAELADLWMDLLETAFKTLAEHPERHGFARENRRWMPEISIRQMRFKPWTTSPAWRILYVIDKKARRVTVLQVRHERRPWLPEAEL